MKLNHIYNECCLSTMKKMPNNFIDLTLTSPPYDDMRTYNKFSTKEFKRIAKSLYRVTKPGGVLVWIVGDQTIKGDETGNSFKQALYFKEVGFNLFDTMIYSKSPRAGSSSNKTYWNAFDFMFILSKGQPKTINLIKDRKNKESRQKQAGTKRHKNGELIHTNRGGYSEFGRRTNIWQYNTGRGHSTSDKIAYKHPAIYPEKLAADHIYTWSNANNLIYDPFLGSGTTAKMAKISNRNWIGSEISEQYCKIIEQRLAAIIL